MRRKEEGRVGGRDKDGGRGVREEGREKDG